MRHTRAHILDLAGPHPLAGGLQGDKMKRSDTISFSPKKIALAKLQQKEAEILEQLRLVRLQMSMLGITKTLKRLGLFKG